MTKYAERDAFSLEPYSYYSWHVAAMTQERLDRKSDIAAELAFRDQHIARLEAENARLKGQVETLRAHIAPKGPDGWTECSLCGNAWRDDFHPETPTHRHDCALRDTAPAKEKPDGT